jgi:PadR family transcriptional regulator, regulatory protein PadR
MTAAIASLPKDFLRPCLLLLLREKQAHGYDLLERVQEMGFEGVDPGGLYRTLRRLEREGLVSSSWEPSESGPQRRIYEITRTGMEELHARAKAIAAGQGRIEAFLSRYEEFVALRRDARARSGNVGRDRTGTR